MSLGQAAIDVTADTSQFESGLKSGVGRAAKAIGVGVAAVGALGAAAVGASFKVAAMGDDLDKTSARLGVHSDFLQDARFWADQNGIAHTAMEKAVGVLNQRLGDGSAEGNQYVEAMNALGVATLDAEGQVRSAEQVMTDTITALMGMESASEQAAAAEDLFGARAARELLPALREGSLTLADATAAMDGFGRMTEDQVKASAEFTDTWSRITTAGKALLTQALFPLVEFMNESVFPVIEDKVIPALQHLFGVFNEGEGIVDGFLGVFESLTGGGGIGSIFEKVRGIIQNVFSSIVSWLASGGVTQILNTLLDARSRLLDAAMQLFPVILTALIEFVPELLGFITGELIPAIIELVTSAVPMLLEAAVVLFESLIEAVTVVLPELLGVLLGEVLPNLLETVVGMVPQLLTTAVTLFEALITAVVKILPGLLSMLLGTVLPNLLKTLLGMVPQLLATAITLFVSLVTAVVTILPQLINILLVEVLPAVLTTVLGMIPELLAAAITTFFALIEAVIEILPQLIGIIVTEVVPGVVNAVITMGPQLLTAGKEVMNQLWAGIKEVGAKVVQWVKDNVVGAIKNLWPFSPAKEGPFAGRGSPLYAGRNIALMLAEGIADMAPSVVSAAEELTRAAAAALDDVNIAAPTVARAGTLTSAGATSTGGVLSIDVGGISVTVQGDMSRERARQVGGDLGEALLERLSRARVVQ